MRESSYINSTGKACIKLDMSEHLTLINILYRYMIIYTSNDT
jgi:hypothetical protein